VLDGDASPADRAAAHLVLGKLAEGSDAGRSLGHLTTAVELDPEATEARLALAMALGRSGRFDDAARQFDRLVEQQPDAVDLRLGQAMALLLGADYSRAERALAAARERFPDESDLTHSLARLLATCPDAGVRDGARALNLAQEALAARRSFDYAQTVAMALAELGRFEEAVSWQERVIEGLRAAGAEDPVARAETYLGHYRRGEPVRAPWREQG
jgi:tetratricopeptide (TPR) repeat protein